MRVVCIQTMDELSAHGSALKNFMNAVKPDYSSHVVDALLEWFNCFSTGEESSFASKRGINFWGRKSRLDSLFFLLLYDSDALVAFAPLFRFRVHLGDQANQIELLAFCPDSTVFFYNDIHVKEGLEVVAVQELFAFIRTCNNSLPYILLFNHIPSDSIVLPLLVKNAAELSQDGFLLAVSPLFWRGGLYPWNLDAIKALLENAQNDECYSESTRTRIRRAADALSATNKTMLAFKNNHLPLKSIIYEIFSENRPSDTLLELYTEIESAFQSHPVKYPYLALPETSDAFVNSLSSSKRYYFQRYRKQFLARSGLFIRLHGDSIADQDIHDFIELHRARWDKKSNILNSLTTEFIFSFLKKMAQNGLLTLFFAVYESERIACICCLDFHDRREFFSSGRLLQYEKLRAGKLLLYETIMDAVVAGFSRFDFAYGDEAYKSDYNWSYRINNVVGLFHYLQPRQYPNIFPLYEEVML